jgi:hypothetical protein
MEGTPDAAAAPLDRKQRHPLADAVKLRRDDRRERRVGAKHSLPIRELESGNPLQVQPLTADIPAHDVRQRHPNRRFAKGQGEPQQAAPPGYTQPQWLGERRLKRGPLGDFRDRDG